MFAKLQCRLTRIAYDFRGLALPLFLPALELQERTGVGGFSARLPHDGPTFLDHSIKVEFETGFKCFLAADQLLALTRPIPLRDLGWLRALLPNFSNAIPIIVSTLQAMEPDFADPLAMAGELINPLISLGEFDKRYGNWNFSVERPIFGKGYGYSIRFNRFSVQDTYIGEVDS